MNGGLRFDIVRRRHVARRRGGCRAARLAALACLLLSAVAHGSAGARQGEPPAKVWDSILGVRVGSSLEEAHAALKELGTVGGRATREGGRKEAWTLKKTEFASVAYQTDGKGRVKWVTGFVRPGREIPFAKLGDLARASGKTDSQAIWNVQTPGGDYRLVAKGPDGKARVIYLFSLNLPPAS